MQLAVLEHRPIETAVLEYLAVYRSTPHATTGVPPAVLLHGHAPHTLLDIVGLSPSSAFFYKPALEIAQLRKRVRDKQMSSKEYTDRKKGAKVPTFRTGDFVRVKNPHVPRKGNLSYSEPLKIEGKKGSSAFTLEDNTWNAARLSKVPYTGYQGAQR